MLTSSSPTISAPTSPSAPFYPHSRSYHASRRISASSSVLISPRFYPQVTGPSVRRLDAPSATASGASLQSPALVVPFARSPQPPKRREYSDAGTQYSPPGFPPTYHPTAPNTTELTLEDAASGTSRTSTKRRGDSAEPTVTEPSEPDLRVDPQPQSQVALQTVAHTNKSSAESHTDKPGREKTRQDETQREVQDTLPVKRARPAEPAIKIMPLKYENCQVKDLGVLVSDMLMELVRLNDAIPLRDGQLTRFHSRAPPGISVRDYLTRLIIHATLSPPIILSMVFYVDRLCSLYPAFTISSLTVHRFLITAATVAAKGLSDSFWTNSLYARVGGVSVRELALLELEFLRRLEWRIVPKPETLVDYYKGLVERGTGYVLEREPKSKSPSSTGGEHRSVAPENRSRVTSWFMDADVPEAEAPNT